MKIEQNVKQTLKIALVFLTVGLLLGTLIAFAATPSSPFYISSGIYPGAPSYTIENEGSNYFAKDANGLIEFSGTSFPTVIQSTINVSTDGTTIFLRKGVYALGTTTLRILEHAITIEGEKSDIVGDRGTIITYSGTGTAIQIYRSGIRLMKTRIKHLDVVALGNAKTSNSKGIWIYNAEDIILEDVTVRDFEAGNGIVVFCDSTSYVAHVVISECYLYQNKYGVFCYGNSSAHEVNTVQILNTIIIGKTGPTAGSRGITYDNYTHTCLVLAGDVETYETAFYIDGDDNTWINTRSEVIGTTHFSFSALASNNLVFNHHFYGGGIKFSDSGTENLRKYCKEYLTEKSGTAEASNTDTIYFGVTFAGTPQTVIITVNENDARYIAQAYSISTTQFLLYLWDDTAGALETTNKTISWYAEYTP